MTQDGFRTAAPEVGARAGASQPYIDWGAIFIGSIIALAVSLIASAFGAAIGLSVADPYHGPKPLFYYWALGLWVLWVAVLTFLAGGYAAGRMRRPIHVVNPVEMRFRDGMHGLAVWGLVVIVGMLLTSTILAGSTKATKELSKNVEPQAKYTDLLVRGDGDVKGGAPPIDASTRQVVEHIVALTPSGDFSERDRNYLLAVVAARTSLAPSDAETRIAEVSAEMKADTEKRRKIGVIVGFFTASTLAIGAATSWAAAKRGAAHQDEDSVA